MSKSFKHIFCAYVNTYYGCEFGYNCRYAHTLNEQRLALEQRKQTKTCQHNTNNNTPCTTAYNTPKPLSQSSSSLPPLKHIMCNNIATYGACKKNNCRYAHNKEEFEAAQIAKKGKESLKYMMCKYILANQTCPNGDNCKYSHSEEERKALQPKNCKEYIHTGKCSFKNCKFNHISKEELELVPQKICELMDANGKCSFGAACRYSHIILTEKETTKFIITIEEEEDDIEDDEEINIDGDINSLVSSFKDLSTDSEILSNFANLYNSL